MLARRSLFRSRARARSFLARVSNPWFALALALATAGVPGIAHAAQGLPEKAPPPGLQAIEGPSGGRLLTGTFPAAGSSDATFLAGLKRVHGYFDGVAHVVGVVRSSDGTTTIGAITGTLRGMPVQGAVITASAPGEPARVALLFDRTGQFAQSIRPLFARLGQLVAASAPSGSASSGSASSGNASAVPPLRAIEANDRTVSAKIPAGWHVMALASGVFAAGGPDGSEVDQEVAVNFLDPRSPVARGGQSYYHVAPYPSDPVQALMTMARLQPNTGLRVERSAPEAAQSGTRIAEVSGTQRLQNGTPGRFIGLVGLSPMNQYGGWSVSVKMMVAPAATFDRELPTLAAVFSSYVVNQSARAGQVQQNINDNQRLVNSLIEKNQDVQRRNTDVFNASMQNARNVQNSIDRSTAGFVNYLNDTTVVQNASGGTSTVSQNFASSLVRSNPNAFREVPVSEYRQGTEF